MQQKHRYYSNQKQSKYILMSKDELKNSKTRYNINQTKIKIIPQKQVNLSSYLPRNNLTQQKVVENSMDKTFTNTFTKNMARNSQYIQDSSKQEFNRQKGNSQNNALKNIISYENKKKGRSYFFNKKPEQKILINENYTQVNLRQSKKKQEIMISEQARPCMKIQDKQVIDEPSSELDIQQIHYEMVKVQQKCKKIDNN